jgi:hypothetical protein
MTRAKISEYSATANDNTDVNGTNIAEGCPPSSMNNMGREIMAALKRFQVGSDGDGVTVGGALVVSGATTANTFSATAVNATGTVTFSGSVILSGTTTANTFSTDLITEKTSAAGVTVDGVLLKDNGVVTGAGTVSAPVYSTTGDLNTGIFFPAADTIAFAEGGAEAMRINSSGNVGIGTSSPARNLSISGSTISYLQLTNGTAGTAEADGLEIFCNGLDAGISNRENGFLRFDTNNTERARITSGGYFKASNNGSYRGATDNYHEFVSNQNALPAVNVYSTGASFANTAVIQGVAVRSANSAYDLLDLYSGDTGDLEFRLRGDGNGYADGTWNNNGADYAEFFESANGEALTLGATVVLDGNKVREATEQDPASAIIGVVRPKEPSKASMVVGNTAWNKWANKYLSDDFDRYIMEDHDVVEWTDEEGKSHSYESQAIPEGITVPADATRKTHDEKGNKFQHYKLNPAWNPDSEYVNRENRPEWNIIGLLGQVKILKGQPVGDRWVKMRDVSETVEEWFIR